MRLTETGAENINGLGNVSAHPTLAKGHSSCQTDEGHPDGQNLSSKLSRLSSVYGRKTIIIIKSLGQIILHRENDTATSWHLRKGMLRTKCNQYVLDNHLVYDHDCCAMLLLEGVSFHRFCTLILSYLWVHRVYQLL